jgi:hypothetical protein|nr:MAG TPA: hypothetical protein [Caudoviricetes sp.]
MGQIVRQTGDYTSAHLGYTLTYVVDYRFDSDVDDFRDTYLDISASYDGETHWVRYTVHRREVEIDLSEIFKVFFAKKYKGRQILLGHVPIINVNLSFSCVKMLDRRTRKVLESERVDLVVVDATCSSYELRIGKRLGGEGKVYYKGYPQIDTYLYSENGVFKGVNILRGTRSITVGDITFYPRGEVTREIDRCGVFLRWRTRYGNWGYGLFSKKYVEEVKRKSLGGWDRNVYEWRERKMVGMTSIREWKLKESVPILNDEIEEYKDLLVSDEVYLYIGERKDSDWEDSDTFFASSQWREVEVVEGNDAYESVTGRYGMSVTIRFAEDVNRRKR